MSSIVYVKHINDMNGVFLAGSCKSGDVVRDLNGFEITNSPTRTSIQVAEGVHVEDKIGSYVNHDCNPSCEVDGTKLIALRDLYPGDEITFDYSKSESMMASPFTCRCCGKTISGK
jgi:hypothetical protein